MTDSTDPRLPARSGMAKQLVILLHGYGADGRDLIDIADAWADDLPDAAFVAPHAPEPCAEAPVGRQWFRLTDREPPERWRGVTQAGPALDAVLDAELARHEVPGDRLALVGFSQGAMMALHVGLRRAPAPAAIVGYSGLLVLEPGRGAGSLTAAITGRPPVLLVHGDQDGVVPAEALRFSADALLGAGIACEHHLTTGLGHGIDEAGLRRGARFLRRAFGLD